MSGVAGLKAALEFGIALFVRLRKVILIITLGLRKACMHSCRWYVRFVSSVSWPLFFSPNGRYLTCLDLSGLKRRNLSSFRASSVCPAILSFIHL